MRPAWCWPPPYGGSVYGRNLDHSLNAVKSVLEAEAAPAPEPEQRPAAEPEAETDTEAKTNKPLAKLARAFVYWVAKGSS